MQDVDNWLVLLTISYQKGAAAPYCIWACRLMVKLNKQFSDKKVTYKISSNVFFFCYRNGYHGTSPGTLGILAHNTWKLNVPVGFGVYQVK